MTFSPTWVFDNSPILDPMGKGQEVVDFKRRWRHIKSTAPDHALVLDPFWERIDRRIYGPRHPDGRRIVQTVVIMLPRGNGKTAWLGSEIAVHLFGPEHTIGGQVISAGPDQNTARRPFQEFVDSASLMNAEGVLQVQDFKSRVWCPRLRSSYQAVPADAKNQHGGTDTAVFMEELHAWPKPDLFHVLRTSLAKTAGSLLVIVTTAGRGQENIAYEMISYAAKVQSGEIDDPATLPILFGADRLDDWRDEKVWFQVNPGLPYGRPPIEGLRQLAREAEQRPGDREAFRQLHLNIWLDHSTDPFVDTAVYDEGAAAVDLEALKGERCWVAVDMGLTTDLTAVVACWREGADGYQVAAWFFCPADNLRARADRDGVPYPTWAEAGFIIATPGNVTDYRAVEHHLRDLAERFSVQEFIFDPAYAQAVMAPLHESGLPCVTMRQGWITMAPAIKELERAIVGRKLKHGGNPVLRWNFDNVAVETDKAGNRSFHKGKSRDRIDGAVACAMAVARAATVETGRSIYDRPELWGVTPSAPDATATTSTPVASSRDGFDWEILTNPRDPRWQAEKDRFERHLELNDADEW